MISMIDEKYWQDEWDREKLFLARKKGSKKFFITVPWPYTSGPLHVGHGRTYTIADFIARFKRLTGYNVLFPMGFHESGTPIEAIADKIRKGDQKTLDLYRKYISEYEDRDNVENIIKKFHNPQEVADFFADKIVKDFKALGYSIDWSRTFKSVDERYKKMVEWQFRKLNSLGLIKKGNHAVLYSPEDGNAVGEDDIDEGDTNKVSIEEFVTVLFRTDDFYLAASSLRPETIPAITNLWVNPKAQYVIVSIDEKKVVMSQDAYEKYKFQNRNIDLIDTCPVSIILEKGYEIPMNGRKVKAFPNEEIDPEHATGIVYSVPGHSVKDYKYILAADINVDIPVIIEIKGKDTNIREYLDKFEDINEANSNLYRDEYYLGKIKSSVEEISGLNVREAREFIKDKLIREKLAFIFLETSRKAKTRNGARVIVSILEDQWFIDYSDEKWKELTRGHVRDMFFYPDFYKKNMLDIVDWIAERACARKRGLGTKLPMDREWVIESLSDSTIYPAFYTMAPFINEADKLNDQIMDAIIDNKSSDIVNGDLKIAKEEFEYWYGVDQRITSSPHMSNHLIFYIMNHVALMKREYWPKGITISGTVISNGAKISKSKGNAVSLLEVVKKYGADMFRMYVAVNSDISSTLDWNEKDISIIRNKYGELCSILEKASKETGKGEGIEYDLFFSRFTLHMQRYNEKMEKMSVRDAYVEMIYEVLNDLNELEGMGGEAPRAVRRIARQWLQVLSCVIPHTCEHFWREFGFKDYVSSSLLELQEIEDSHKKIIDQWDYCKLLIEDVKAIEKVTKIKAEKVNIVIANKNVMEDVKKILENNFEVKRKDLIQNVKKMKSKINTEIDELESLKRFKSIIEKKYGWTINIRENGDEDKKTPLPGRPIINIEGEKNGNN